MNEDQGLTELQRGFRAGSTNAMPLAGAITWAALGIAALLLEPRTVGTLALYIMAAIMPLAFLIDRARGRNLFAGGTDNPLTKLFLLSILLIGLVVPLVVIGATAARSPDLVVLGMAILAGVIWIPYGWAADDPVGIRHAVVRAVGCYAAFAFCPAPYRAAAICGVVVLSYIYALARMRPTGQAEPVLT